MRILILGFGPYAREILAKIKTFPEYGENREIAAGHIHVARNSLSYGPDYVVEFPDPHGDGYRTYNDGFQAIDEFSTTVSDYEEHILGEVSKGSFSVIIDCTNETESAKELLTKMQEAAGDKVSFILANKLEGVDATIKKIRELYDGGKPWEPVEYTSTFLADAWSKWEAANKKMGELHLMKRTQFCEEHPEGVGRTAREFPTLTNLIPEVDQRSIKRFIADNEPYSIKYDREETYDENSKCRIIRHEMLDWFFGWHCTEGPATQIHSNPRLQIASAKYVEYSSADGQQLAEEDFNYALEYIVKGTLEISNNAGDTSTISENLAYAYMPKINPPTRKVHEGLSTMIFYYKEKDDN